MQADLLLALGRMLCGVEMGFELCECLNVYKAILLIISGIELHGKPKRELS